MTDRIDMAALQEAFKNAPYISAAIVFRVLIEDRNQGNVSYLENNGCSVGKLDMILKSMIDETVDELISEGQLEMGKTLIDNDCIRLYKFMEEHIKDKKDYPNFEELVDFMLKTNQANKEHFEEIIFALNSSGFSVAKVKEQSKYKNINKYCVDLVAKATNNRLDPLIGREADVGRMIEIMAHYKKSNPLLVGPAGVGKTQIVEGLASAIAKGEVPEAIKEAKIFDTDVARLMAGTKFRGDVEEKLQELLKELQKYEEETGFPTYLFIDEIHQISSAGSSNKDGSNIANIIKPALASGELSLIGATTTKEYKRTIQKDSALDRRFQVIKIVEPSDEETIKILKRGIAPVLSNYHGVTYSSKVIEKAVHLTSKFITDKAQPDKSISLLDSVGARLRTKESRTTAKITDVEDIVSMITGTPTSAFKEKKGKDAYVDLEAELKKRVFGQDEAIKQIVDIYERAKAGLNEDGQPIGSVLAVGPTGVGKTEVAKVLAELTEAHFFKVNMGEYGEKHSVAKLFGAPPGYVGHGEGGILTNEIRNNPHTILLLDEIEKAHPKVFESLLGIIDGAKMTDGEGNEVDFSNVMVLMTSNAGAAKAESTKAPITFNRSLETIIKAKDSVSEEEIAKTFAPEFRNKLTATVRFNKLSADHIRLVTDKFLTLAKDRLFTKKGVKVEFEESVYDYISTQGFDDKFGARPIKKLIDIKVVDVLVKPILRGEIVSGDELVFDIANEDVVYSKKELVTEEV